MTTSSVSRVSRWWRRAFPPPRPLDPTKCYASVECFIAGTWSCPCGAHEGGICPAAKDEKGGSDGRR